MASNRLRKRMALRRKLLVLRTLTNSKSVKRSSIIVDAFLHICKLKLRLEAIQREYLLLMKHIQVKVEKVQEHNFLMKVSCKGGNDVLVSILEAFEEMGLNVLQARVSCNSLLTIEAIVEAQDQGMDERDIREAVHKAIFKQEGPLQGTQNTVEAAAVNDFK
ncbi:hypothetical protein NMG60_11012875 [Bertholletia excelsa]